MTALTEYRMEVLRSFADGSYHSAGAGTWAVATKWLHEHGYLGEHGVQRGHYKLTWLGRNALEAERVEEEVR